MQTTLGSPVGASRRSSLGIAAQARHPASPEALPRERPVDGEVFAPIELSHELRADLEPIAYVGDSPFKGRLSRVRGWDAWPMERKLAFLRRLAEDTARDPAIAQKATQIIRQAGVPLRDHEQEWRALLRWTQRNIRFTAEPNERLQSPQYTLSVKMGDCLAETTPIRVRGEGDIPLARVEVGAEIMGRTGWTRVEAIVEKGPLATWEIRLETGRAFRPTSDHKVYVVRDEGRVERVPVFSLDVGDRLLSPFRERGYKVTSIVRDVAVEACRDLQTTDHYVYLPAADVTVSNCDDLAVALAGLAHSIRLPFRFVVSGRLGKERARYVEGSGAPPRRADWTHIYLLAGWPPFRPVEWAWAEPTLDVPLGWDILKDAIPSGRTDLSGAFGTTAAAAIVGDKTHMERVEAWARGLPWRQIGTGVAVSVLGYAALQAARSPTTRARPRQSR